MLHSQRLNEPPLKPWVIAEEVGTVTSAHCTCMAGLAEVCTHIASILFWLEFTVKKRESMTVTDISYTYWVAPSLQKTANTQKRLVEIDFTSPAAKKLIKVIKVYQIARPTFCRPVVPKTYKPPPLPVNLSNLYADLNNLKQKPVLLSVLSNYCEQFSSNQTTKSYPKVLTELYDEKYKSLNYANLLLKCDEISFAVNFTEEQAKLIFNETQKHCNCQKWYDFRSGRVTASVSGEVCNSRDEMPPVSLIKKYAINQNLEVWLQTGVIKTKMMPVISIANLCQNLM